MKLVCSSVCEDNQQHCKFQLHSPVPQCLCPSLTARQSVCLRYSPRLAQSSRVQLLIGGTLAYRFANLAFPRPHSHCLRRASKVEHLCRWLKTFACFLPRTIQTFPYASSLCYPLRSRRKFLFCASKQRVPLNPLVCASQSEVQCHSAQSNQSIGSVWRFDWLIGPRPPTPECISERQFERRTVREYEGLPRRATVFVFTGASIKGK